jgi:putative transcriptional regulator
MMTDAQLQARDAKRDIGAELLAAVRMRSGLSQSEFARATGVSVRTLQEWEQGRKVPSGAAQSLIKLISRHPELLAELA